MRYISILTNLILLLIAGCNEPGTADFENLPIDLSPKEESPYSKMNFGGIDAVEDLGFNRATVTWTERPDAITYEVFDVSTQPPSLIAQLVSPASEYTLENLAVGETYAIRVKALDEDGLYDSNTNDQTFETLACPENYLFVDENTELGSNSFCVMQFEAKDVGGVATSQAEELPWADITRIDAYAECEDLNEEIGVNAKFGLIANLEWLAIAREIENNTANWSGGEIGNGMINRGNSDTSPNSRLSVTDVLDPYDGTGNNSSQATSSGWEQKRTHQLSSGEIIWDFAGNVFEAIDWEVDGGLDSGPTGCSTGGRWRGLNSSSCAGLAPGDYQSNDSTYNSNQGIGNFFADGSGLVYRGGAYGWGKDVGIYNLGFAYGATFKGPYVGFRCVYRLKP